MEGERKRKRLRKTGKKAEKLREVEEKWGGGGAV